jgi:hypothetical protein
MRNKMLLYLCGRFGRKGLEMKGLKREMRQKGKSGLEKKCKKVCTKVWLGGKEVCTFAARFGG